jgi:membrane protein required for beta-lactamase induction
MSLALLPIRLGENLARRLNMKKIILALALLIGLTQSGCAFLGGAAVGSLATGAGYEVNAHHQMEKLDADYRNERISRREYESRKTQIEKGSILY